MNIHAKNKFDIVANQHLTLPTRRLTFLSKQLISPSIMNHCWIWIIIGFCNEAGNIQMQK